MFFVLCLRCISVVCVSPKMLMFQPKMRRLYLFTHNTDALFQHSLSPIISSLFYTGLPVVCKRRDETRRDKENETNSTRRRLQRRQHHEAHYFYSSLHYGRCFLSGHSGPHCHGAQHLAKATDQGVFCIVTGG
jgi:hypothetical protein